MENETLDLMQAKLNVFATKLSQAYDIEGQLVHELNKARKTIADLEEELNVSKNPEE